MKTHLANTIAAFIFSLLMGFSSLAVADSTSSEVQQVVPQSVAAGTLMESASSQNLPVFTLPEIVCRAKKTPSLPRILFDKVIKDGVANIKMPKIRMVDFSALINEMLHTQK